jgi:hypothetical protein
VFIKTTFEASGLPLEEDRLEITCGGELKVVVSIERAKTANKFNCTALGDATPPPEFALDLTGNADPQANPKFVQYLINTESRLFYEYLRRTIKGYSCGDGASLSILVLRSIGKRPGRWTVGNGAQSKLLLGSQ